MLKLTTSLRFFSKLKVAIQLHGVREREIALRFVVLAVFMMGSATALGEELLARTSIMAVSESQTEFPR